MPDDTPPDAAGDPAARARRYLLAEHRPLVATTLDCADAVAADWERSRVSDGDRIAGPLRAALDRAGVLAACPGALRGAIEAAGYEPTAEPVAAPPYVVVTSIGLLLRATVGDGRLVATVAAFRVERSADGPRYRRGAETPETALSVALR